MYEKYFGLNKEPFPGYPTGEAVFAGPSQERMLAGLRKSLAWSDAIVVVSGPIGVGKTVIVEHALASIAPNRAVARIGRIPLERDELLELLLTEFGLDDPPAGRVQRYASFQRLLKGWAESNTRIYIVVEDAVRTGAEALAELEALTAACSGDVRGAQLLLLGPPELGRLLSNPELARLRQRVRGRLEIQPLEPSAVGDYVAHGLRVAGGDPDRILGEDALNAIARFSDGIPRLVSSLCEAALISAAEDGRDSIDAALIEQVAVEELGLADGSAATPAGDESPMPELIQDTLPPFPALDESDPSAVYRARAAESAATPTPDSRAEMNLAMLEPRAPERLSKNAGPDDTRSMQALEDALRPDTQLLRTLEEPPALEEDDAPVPLGLQGQVAPRSESPAGTGTGRLPTLSDSMRLKTPAATAAPAPADAAKPGKTAKTPELMPEITLDRKLEEHAREAQERLAAEAAKAAAKAAALPGVGDEPESGPTGARSAPRSAAETPATATPAETAPAAATPADTPAAAATPAKSSPRQSEADATKPRTERPNAPPTPATPPKTRSPAPASRPEQSTGAAPAAAGKGPNGIDARGEAPPPGKTLPAADREQLDRVAAQLKSAKTLEEIVDEKAAETLFGEEFSEMAAAVAAMAPSDEPGTEEPADAARDDAAQAAPAALELAPDPPATKPGGDANGRKPVAPARPAAAPTAAPSAVRPRPSGNGKARPATPRPGGANSPDREASRRLEMVRKLNGRKASKGQPQPNAAERPAPPDGGRSKAGAAPLAPTRGPADQPIENQYGSSMTRTLEALVSRQQRKDPPPAQESKPAARGPQPEPIENQFGLTMTQTLRALSLRSAKESAAQPAAPVDGDDDDDDDDTGRRKFRGLLNRLRRS